MNNKDIIKQCKALSYSKYKRIDQQIVEKTIAELAILYDKWSYADVLGELSTLWSFREASLFWKYVGKQEKKRKIKTIASYYKRAYAGGIERVNAELLSIWVELGYRVIFFTEETESPLDFPYPGAVKRIVIHSKDIKGKLYELQDNCINENVDLFINHSWDNTNSLWICILMRALGILYLVYCHGHFAWNYREGENAFFLAQNYRLADMLLAISETNARYYQLLGCKTYLVMNPIPRDLITNVSGGSLDSNRLLLIGRLDAEKYPMEAIEIFKSVHNVIHDVILDIVGDGVYLDDVRRYVVENGLENNVVFHGFMNNNEIASIYKRTSCVIFTSKMEGYPMVVLEAKAYGLPIVMYNLPYLTLLKDRKGFIAVPEGDIKGMVDAIVRVMQDRGLRIQMGKEARDSFETLAAYDVGKNWQNIIDILEKRKSSEQITVYYDPDRLDDSDRCIIPMLQEEALKGYDSFYMRRDYKVGRAVLLFPRAIRNVILKFKRIIMSKK